MCNFLSFPSGWDTSERSVNNVVSNIVAVITSDSMTRDLVFTSLEHKTVQNYNQSVMDDEFNSM